MIDHDQKALGTLILWFSPKINHRFGEHTGAKSLYDAICDIYDVNDDLVKDKGMWCVKSILIKFNKF